MAVTIFPQRDRSVEAYRFSLAAKFHIEPLPSHVTAARYLPSGDKAIVCNRSPGTVNATSSSFFATERSSARAFRGAVKNAMVEGLVFSSDGKTFMTGSLDSLLRIWNTETGESVRDLTGRKTVVTAAVFSYDGKKLYTSGLRGDLIQWNVATGDFTNSITAHGERFYGLALSGDGKRIITAGWDHQIKVWDANTFHCHSHTRRPCSRLSVRMMV